jgi:hypothetical protein
MAVSFDSPPLLAGFGYNIKLEMMLIKGGLYESKVFRS